VIAQVMMTFWETAMIATSSPTRTYRSLCERIVIIVKIISVFCGRSR